MFAAFCLRGGCGSKAASDPPPGAQLQITFHASAYIKALIPSVKCQPLLQIKSAPEFNNNKTSAN